MRIAKFIMIVMLSIAMTTAWAGTVLQDTQDHLIDINSVKGKWVIVNFWAEWCGPCVKEIPELNHFYKMNKDKNVVLYGVYYDHVNFDDLKRLARGARIEFPVLSEDPTLEWQLGEVSILPTTFILNPKGEVVKTIYGASTESGLVDTLRELRKNYAAN